MPIKGPIRAVDDYLQARRDITNLGGEPTPELKAALKLSRKAFWAWMAACGVAVTGIDKGVKLLVEEFHEHGARSKAATAKERMDKRFPDFPEEERWRLARGEAEFPMLNGPLIDSIDAHGQVINKFGRKFKGPKADKHFSQLRDTYFRFGKSRMILEKNILQELFSDSDPLKARPRFSIYSKLINIDLLETRRLAKEKPLTPNDEWFLGNDMPMYDRETNTLYIPAAFLFKDYIENIVGPYIFVALSDAQVALVTRSSEQYEDGRYKWIERSGEVYFSMVDTFYAYDLLKEVLEKVDLTESSPNSELLAQFILDMARKKVAARFAADTVHDLGNAAHQANFIRQEECRLAYLAVRLLIGETGKQPALKRLQSTLLEIANNPTLIK